MAADSGMEVKMDSRSTTPNFWAIELKGSATRSAISNFLIIVRYGNKF